MQNVQENTANAHGANASLVIYQVETNFTIDFPHKLKSGQVQELNKLVDSVSKYEATLMNLSKASLFIYDQYLHVHQQQNDQLIEILQTLQDIRLAIEPPENEGDFSRFDGLRGPWNKDLQRYEQYR